MTTYAYEPLVGITSQCDVNNKISYYIYDGLQRLVLIRDQDKNIVKKICYNYAGQAENCTQYGNVPKSGIYTKVCTGGLTGSSVTYTVPADTYFALTQLAADQLAQNDVNANGQAYANANGTCTAAACSFTGYTGFVLGSNSISKTSSTVNFTITFNSASGSTSWTSLNQIATVNGSCKPVAPQVFSLPEGTTGRTWQIVVTVAGAFSVQLLGGPAPSGTNTITIAGTYTP